MLQPQNMAPQVAGDKKFKQEVDTNVFQVSMKCIENQVENSEKEGMKYCGKCKAAFNKFSKVENEKWNCEFCCFQNAFDISGFDFPQQEEMTYCTYRPPTEEETKGSEPNKKYEDEGVIIFCLDISGSMGGGRLETIKKVLSTKLEQLHKENPKKKFGFVSFGSAVETYLPQAPQLGFFGALKKKISSSVSSVN